MVVGVLGEKSRFIDFVAPIYSGFNNSLEDHTKLTDIAIVVFHVGLSNWLKETRSLKTGYTFVVGTKIKSTITVSFHGVWSTSPECHYKRPLSDSSSQILY